MMKRKILTLTLLVALVAALAALLSGCSGATDPTEGKYVVTFEANGGILSYGTSSTDGRVNYAYYPGTYVKDPTTFPNYSIYRPDYVFTGWYTSKDCNPDEKWNFENGTIEQEKLVLYAGWEVAINYTYSVKYLDGTNEVTLGTYKVTAGEKFEDWRDYASLRDGYTPNGFFKDSDCTVPWNFSEQHPGGLSDLDIPVYVKYIEGNWKLVEDFNQLKSALNNGFGVYLMNDIDCEGKELYVSSSYGMILEGNGFKISNFTVPTKGTTYTPTVAIFNKLVSGAEIRNVSFENVSYNFTVKSSIPQSEIVAKVAALAVNFEQGVKVTNVSITGTLVTNYEGELPCLEKVFYSKTENDALLSGVTGFSADITIVNN